MYRDGWSRDSPPAHRLAARGESTAQTAHLGAGFAERETYDWNLDSAQIDRLLRAEWKGRIGCHARGRTYVVPVSYVYDGDSIFGQTGGGLKVQMMRENPLVCFEIDASSDIASWESVIVHGAYEELRDQAAQAAVVMLTERLRALATSTGAIPPRGAGRIAVGSEPTGPRQEVVYRIVIAERSGRYRARVIERHLPALQASRGVADW